jgi:hypothetical protein
MGVDIAMRVIRQTTKTKTWKGIGRGGVIKYNIPISPKITTVVPSLARDIESSLHRDHGDIRCLLWALASLSLIA